RAISMHDRVQTSNGDTRRNAFPRFLACRSAQTHVDWPVDVCTADRKSAGASDVLEAPVIIGGPSRTRTLDPLIKSHFGLGGIGHHRTECAAITRRERVSPVLMLRVA